MTSRVACLDLDHADPLARFRDRFVLPEGVIYLDGNSLGPITAGVALRVADTVEHEWGTGLIRSWNDAGWVDLPRRVGDRIARLIGAVAGTVVVCDSTSVNLHKAVSAACRMRPDRGRIVTDASNFPTDLYVLEAVCAANGVGLEIVEPDRVLDTICDDTAAVVLTEVDYRTGRRIDLDRLTAAAHASGALAVWDLAHSAGAFPVALEAAEVDLAVGCGYKYLNGGPGAPAFLYVALRHQGEFSNPMTGWFGHCRPFAFEPGFDPAGDISRGMVGTPPIIGLSALDAALDAFDDVDMAMVRSKSVALTDLFMDLVAEHLPSLEILTPRSHFERGSQVSLRHPRARLVMAALIARGVIGDFRTPDVLRFGLAPLYVRFVDVFDAVEQLTEVITGGEYETARPRGAVS